MQQGSTHEHDISLEYDDNDDAQERALPLLIQVPFSLAFVQADTYPRRHTLDITFEGICVICETTYQSLCRSWSFPVDFGRFHTTIEIFI
jgi:hypothetical protein